jgi:galactokinase
MSTVAEEIKQDMPIERVGSIADIISEEKILQGAVALTVENRPYHIAAKELRTLTKRRVDVLREYEALMKTTHASLEELFRVHTRIDQIVNELSRS